MDRYWSVAYERLLVMNKLLWLGSGTFYLDDPGSNPEIVRLFLLTLPWFRRHVKLLVPRISDREDLTFLTQNWHYSSYKRLFFLWNKFKLLSLPYEIPSSFLFRLFTLRQIEMYLVSINATLLIIENELLINYNPYDQLWWLIQVHLSSAIYYTLSELWNCDPSALLLFCPSVINT